MKEIERKFLVQNDEWEKNYTRRAVITQGYLLKSNGYVVRIRAVKTKWKQFMLDDGFITIKRFNNNINAVINDEYEYKIPYHDATEMLNDVKYLTKTRYYIFHDSKEWTVDVFFEENAGLKLAEIELTHESEHIELPPWIGEEVTTDRRYNNAYLVDNPYNNW